MIVSITGKLPSSQRIFNVDLQGRNLLIVGGNGSGKTSLLSSLHAQLRIQIIEQGLKHKSDYERNIAVAKNSLEADLLHPNMRSQYLDSLNSSETALKRITHPYTISYNDSDSFIQNYSKKTAVVSFVPAHRKSNIESVTSATSVKKDISQLSQEENLGNKLEQHLVNLKVRSALGSQIGRDEAVLRKIDKWFEDFAVSLRYLFEDDTIRLKFDPDTLKFQLAQEGKLDFTFQNLSSGYSAIFDIYADLLIRTEYLDITPSQLTGILLIDEIDVHLHVSLQRKILPFLAGSFPNVQIIATTHSPFVVTSTTDTLIYDLNTGSENEDLSMFSIEAVVEGLLGVSPVSENLKSIITELTAITSENNFDLSQAEEILEKVQPYTDHIDDESRMFYEIAVNRIIKSRNGA
ncbi:hypothetical protein OX90_07350 [Pseudomonas coronafaciens pv. porri]|uniref:AAA+ ATPase domain-containing protein n=1 Tax=Pseudomonas coronafaciens pv. porri TaxID=83964 RepID=A0ABR5JRY4_9PSED|nr:AAA family ATPase [Pseudomonas coronafaciens]KOP58658.1 hypothetical protein OX88_01280 [Pseudomonas coronafaciens pv. porri]KOP60148.1 hypothetical protein OX90_07350 [Pseudomonas coronafaciens pv. porri]KPY23890.1 Uncharacterized protein ALO89_00063 [Pseudomonas coronafaciens pv. porri]RMU89677.1 hypothetical protein ALP22_03235 [Pseudomonas coronafaciens pv. porri]RMV95741.1 hypothetical protein ALP00_00201 [Pseudomonas coronafaciens pv. porri]